MLVRWRTDNGFDILYILAAEKRGKCRRCRMVGFVGDEPQTTAGVNIMGFREDYQALMEKQLNEWKAQTERFKASAEQIQAQTKAQYEKHLEALRVAQAQAWEHFNKLKDANEGAWTDFKGHMEKAGAEVKSAMESMTANFKK
jgi:hypothetical protein